MKHYLFPITGIPIYSTMVDGKECCALKCRFLQVDKEHGKDYCCFFTHWIQNYTLWGDPIRLPTCIEKSKSDE